MVSNSKDGCGTVIAGLLNLALDTPVIPHEVDIDPAVEDSQPEALPPLYSYQIEPVVYLVGHIICLLTSLGVLWLLLQSPIIPRHVITAVVSWLILGVCSYRALQGVRYGCSLKTYKGYLELQMLGPLQVITVGEIAYFREVQRYNPSRRRIYLYTKAGLRYKLPRVHDPEILWRSLIDDVGAHQII